MSFAVGKESILTALAATAELDLVTTQPEPTTAETHQVTPHPVPVPAYVSSLDGHAFGAILARKNHVTVI